MKKIYIFMLGSLFSFSAFSQDTGIPLFEDDIPNLGREAKPLSEIKLTPSELPDIRVSLDNKTKPTPQTTRTQPTPTVQKPSKPLQLPKETVRLSNEKSNEMNQQLRDEIQKYQEQKNKTTVLKPSVLPQTPTQPKAPTPNLEGLIAKTHDVHTFEISGISLDMTPDEVVEIAKEQGYTVTRVEHGIPLHRTSYYEHNCRNAGARRVAVIQDCIIEQALNDEVYYISSITLSKPQTAEYMKVLFSTHATDNVAYKIYYENEGDNSLNFTRKNLAKKIRRRDAFFNMLYETYGLPDDRELFIWGDPQKAYMKAQMQGANYNAYLILEDKEIPDLDYTDAQEQKEGLRYRNPFTFAPHEDED